MYLKKTYSKCKQPSSLITFNLDKLKNTQIIKVKTKKANNQNSFTNRYSFKFLILNTMETFHLKIQYKTILIQLNDFL